MLARQCSLLASPTHLTLTRQDPQASQLRAFQGRHLTFGVKLAPRRVFFLRVEYFSLQNFLIQMPQKSYFRLALDPELTFTASGALSSGPGVKFQNLPETPVLTMHYHIPDNWLIEPVKSVYDLDNIKLANVDGSIGKIWMIIFL